MTILGLAGGAVPGKATNLNPTIFMGHKADVIPPFFVIRNDMCAVTNYQTII